MGIPRDIGRAQGAGNSPKVSPPGSSPGRPVGPKLVRRASRCDREGEGAEPSGPPPCPFQVPTPTQCGAGLQHQRTRCKSSRDLSSRTSARTSARRPVQGGWQIGRCVGLLPRSERFDSSTARLSLSLPLSSCRRTRRGRGLVVSQVRRVRVPSVASAPFSPDAAEVSPVRRVAPNHEGPVRPRVAALSSPPLDRVAQPGRASPCEGEGRRFNSCRDRPRARAGSKPAARIPVRNQVARRAQETLYIPSGSSPGRPLGPKLVRRAARETAEVRGQNPLDHPPVRSGLSRRRRTSRAISLRVAPRVA